MRTSTILPFIEQLKSAAYILIVTHKNPDGDAIGSSLGLSALLKEHGIKTCVVVEDSLPHFLMFLPQLEDVVVFNQSPSKVQEEMNKASCIICTDFGQMDRCGMIEPLIRQSKAPRLLIDHHPDPDQMAFDAMYHDVKASSTSELVSLFASEFFPETKLSREMATCLYTGLVTDTGCFRFGLRTQTFLVASQLFQLGIDVEQIITSVFDSHSEQRLKLTGFTLLNKLVHLPEYRTAYISLSEEEMKPFDPRKGDTEGLVNYTLSIEHVRFGVFFNQKPDGTIRISFRSKGTFQTNDIARRFFQGGGHRNASGGVFSGTVEEAIQYFLSILPQYQEQLISLP